jgi:hypothetical protein
MVALSPGIEEPGFETYNSYHTGAENQLSQNITPSNIYVAYTAKTLPNYLIVVVLVTVSTNTETSEVTCDPTR